MTKFPSINYRILHCLDLNIYHADILGHSMFLGRTQFVLRPSKAKELAAVISLCYVYSNHIHNLLILGF